MTMMSTVIVNKPKTLATFFVKYGTKCVRISQAREEDTKSSVIHTCIAEILKIKSNKIRKGWLFGSSKNHFSRSMVGFKLPIIKF